ncbi:MAG TPA: hypothetical protein VHP83_01800 [Aggregatilineaceae bacterium]|nr:hypothetical protein [Aggregatilineaceae bacterium]
MTNKRETYRETLRPLLLAALGSPGLLSPAEFNLARFSLNNLRVHLLDPDISALEDYLIDYSNLPGPRADLELIWGFADEVGALCDAPGVSLNRSYVAMEWLLWRLINRYAPAQYGSDADSPLQMPQLCGLVAYGEWAARFHHIEAGVAMLLEQASSELWRIREGAAMGLQRMLALDWDSTMLRLRRRALDAPAYEWRAMMAGVAEPPLLVDAARALDALDLHYGAMAYLRKLPANVRKTDAVRTLRQALGYSVSVCVAHAPEPGFALMQAWAAWDDPDVGWVIRENLKKKRLEKWPEWVARLKGERET